MFQKQCCSIIMLTIITTITTITIIIYLNTKTNNHNMNKNNLNMNTNKINLLFQEKMLSLKNLSLTKIIKKLIIMKILMIMKEEV